MAEYDNTNRWTLSRNKNKRSETDSDFSGSINIDGVEYWLNGWTKTNSKDGSRFFSGTHRRKEQRNGAPRTSNEPLNKQLDDDIPF